MFKKVGKFLAAWAVILIFTYLLVVHPPVAFVFIGGCLLISACICVWSIVNC